jgi:hypothetical protein
MSRSPHARWSLPALVLGLLAALSHAGGDSPAWSKFLPDGAFQELKSRAVATIQSQADRKRKEIEYHLLMGYGYASEMKQGTVRLAAPDDLGEMMNLLRDKAKNGEGIAEALQYNGKLKKQNGIESLIGALAGKALSDDNAAKTSKELELLAYRVAVFGAVTHDNPPTDKIGKDAVAGWRKLSLEMRDAAVALAEAAEKKNIAGIQSASTRLQNNCTQCHRDYRKQ